MTKKVQFEGLVAITGMLWTSLGLLLTKLVAIISQIFLGWYLSSGDFGVYAIAIACSNVFSSFRNLGTQRLLVQRGKNYNILVTHLFKVGLYANIVIALMLIFSSEFISQLYNSQILKPLLIIIGCNIILGTPVSVLQAKMSIDLRFKTNANLRLALSILKAILTVTMAMIGMGPYSFVLPITVCLIIESYILFRLCGGWDVFKKLNLRFVNFAIRKIAWICFGTLFLTLFLTGDYLIVGLFESKEILGNYYFGYELVASLSTVITGSFASVLTPSFVKISKETPRLASAYMRSMSILCYLGAPICFFGLLLSGPVISFVWGGKWDDSIFVAQCMIAVLVIRVSSNTTFYLLEAMGKWRIWTFSLILSALGMFLVVFLGAVNGGLMTISICVAVYFLVHSTFLGILGCHLTGMGVSAFIKGPLLNYLLAAALAILLHQFVFALIQNNVFRILILIIIYPIIYIISIRVLIPQTHTMISKEMMRMINSVKSRISNAPV